MKRNLFSIAIALLVLVYGSVYGQRVQLYPTETSGYPIMVTGFRLFDALDKEIRNETGSTKIFSNDVIINEIEADTIVKRKVLYDPDCAKQSYKAFSAVLVVDISTSMADPLPDGTKRIDAAKEVLREWARSFDPNRTETAITAFCGDAIPSKDNDNEPIRTYTNKKDELITAIDKMPNFCNGTNYNAAFLHKRGDKYTRQLSALYWCSPEKAKYKPVIVFLTDGGHLNEYGAFQIDSVEKYANLYKTTIYVIKFGDEIIDTDNLRDLNRLAQIGKIQGDLTDNIWLDINDADQLKTIYQEILAEAAKYGEPPPCNIRWIGACESGSATFTFPNHGGLVDVSDFVIAPDLKPNLNISPRNPFFSNVAPGTPSATMTVTLKAEKNYIEITGYNVFDLSLIGDFSVIDWGPLAPLPFVIPKDSSCKIVIQYSPKDSNCSDGIVEFLGTACSGREMNVKGEMLPFVEEVDMGNVNVGDEKKDTLTAVFCNKTCQEIKITSRPIIKGGDASSFSILKPTGTSTLQPGECLEMEFEFHPPTTEPAGTKKAKIEIKTDYNNQTFTGDIIGNAIGGKTLVHDDPGFDSASCVKTNIENIIVLENAGVETINDISCSIFPDETNFEIKDDAWPTSLEGGETGIVTIIFHPTNPAKQNADYTATLKVTSDAENDTLDIPLDGPMRNIDFTLSAPVDFAEVCVGTPETRQVTLSNTGNVPLNVNASSVAPFSPANANYNVAVGGNVTIDVECNPTSDGEFKSNLTVTNTECNMTDTISLSAMGVYPNITLDKQYITMTATIGDSASLDLLMTNKSKSTLNLTGILPCEALRFVITDIKPTLPADIEPDSTVSFKVTYIPQIGDYGELITCIQFRGSTCNFDTNVAITGNPGAATVEIAIDEYTGIQGDDIDIDLVLRNGMNFDKSNTTKINTQIRYDGALLQAKYGFDVTDDTGTFKIITLKDKDVFAQNEIQTVETLQFDILMGNTPNSTPLEILNTSGNGGAVFIRNDGLFTLVEQNAIISIDNVSDYVGREVKIKVRLDSQSPLPGNNTDKITLQISFDGTVLEPVNKAPLVKRVFDKPNFQWIATYKLPISPIYDDVLSELPFNSMIGLSKSVIIHIDSVSARGTKFDTVNGVFNVLGLCENKENDVIRFFNPVNPSGILAMNPNPAEGIINIEFETSEKGFTKIWVTDMLGNNVYELYSGVPNPGKADVNLDGTHLSNGVYFIIMQTPTQVIREKIYIMR